MLQYKKRLLLRCIDHFKSDLINNMDHISISGIDMTWHEMPDNKAYDYVLAILHFARGSTQVSLCLFLVCCGCDTPYIVSVHVHCQASIYIHFCCVAGIHGGCGWNSEQPLLLNWFTPPSSNNIPEYRLKHLWRARNEVMNRKQKFQVRGS